MPRQARIDAPGALHHIICRGIERRKIFYDDHDRNSFLKRLGPLLLKTSTKCFAWTLIPNQNRYTSILCQTDPYLLEFVRYMDLNPRRVHSPPV